MAQIEFSEEQNMLLDTAGEFCKTHASIELVRAGIEDDQSVKSEVWKEMADLGWMGIIVPEEYGGLGLGLSDVVPIVESMGRNLMGSPYTSNVLATQALVSSADASQKAFWLPRIVEGEVATIALTEVDGSWKLEEIESSATLIEDRIELSGVKCFVQDLNAANILIVSALLEGEARLLVLDRSVIPESNYEREVVIDETRRSFRLNLEGVSVSEANLLPKADFKALEAAALLMLCAEISGGLMGLLPVIVEYLNTRKAFDRLIGSYQALKHPTVDILMSLEAARSHLYHASTLFAQEKMDDFESAIRMAKAHGSEAFAFAGDRAVQFHGGFGFTYECDAQLFLRRALWCQYQFGDEKYHRQLLAKTLFD